MSRTKINWADAVWNPVTGCSRVSAGCQNCYAERMAKRLAGRCGYPKDKPFRVTLHPERLEAPKEWRKPKRIFVNSMGDLFHPDVPDEWIFKVFETMSNAQWFHGHKFLVLTKRPERMKDIIEQIRLDLEEQRQSVKLPNGMTQHKLVFSFPLQNIWLGVTAENQQSLDERWPILERTPAAHRFVSFEPLLGPIDASRCLGPEITEAMKKPGARCGHHGNLLNGKACPDCFPRTLEWAIVGGETGPGARPCHPDWVRNLRDQVVAAGAAFWFKQWGEWAPMGSDFGQPNSWSSKESPNYKTENWRPGWDGMPYYDAYCSRPMIRIGKKAAGRLLDGRTWEQLPKYAKGAGWEKVAVSDGC